jgi:hypothetical protein
MIDSLTMMSHDNDNFNIAVATGKKNVNNKILKDRFKLSDLK